MPAAATVPAAAPSARDRSALDADLSRKLRALGMVGILMVVVGHSPSYRDPAAPSERSFAYAWAEALSTDALPRVFVMVFFVASGLLLLHGHDGSTATWRRKLAARTRSLLVPYLVWSAIGLAIYAALQSVPWTAHWFAHSTRVVVGRPASDLLLVWLVDPISYQLWFLRDLYLLVLVAPLLLWLLRRFGVFVPVLLLVPYFLDAHVPSPVPGIRLLTSDGYLFFAIGGWLALRAVPPRIPSGLVVPLCALTVALAMVRAYAIAAHQDHAIDVLLWKSTHLVGVFAASGAYDRWLRWLERPFWLDIGGLAFFVFAAHEPLMTMIRKPLVRWLGAGDLRHAIECVATLGITVVSVVGLAWCVRRALPRAFVFLCGGRG